MISSILLNVLKKLTFVTLMVMLFLSSLNFSKNVNRIEEDQRKVLNIARHVSDLQTGLKLDSARTAAIEKITKIMTRYNKTLDAQQQYQIANEIYTMNVKYDNLDVDLICATITHESARSWRPDVLSPAGAVGLMQIMPHTGEFLSRHEGIEWTTPEEVLHNPINNIRMGCRYLSMLIELYHVDGGLAAYNGGERRAARWLASGRDDEVLFEETRGYVPAVLKLYRIYKN